MSQGRRYFVEKLTFGNSKQNLIKQPISEIRPEQFYWKSYNFQNDTTPQLSLSTSRGDSTSNYIYYPSSLPKLIPKTPYKLHAGVITKGKSGVKENSRTLIQSDPKEDGIERNVKNKEVKKQKTDNFLTTQLVKVDSSFSCDPISVESCTQLTNSCSLGVNSLVKPFASKVKKVVAAPPKKAAANKTVVEKVPVAESVIARQTSVQNTTPESPTTSKTAVAKTSVPETIVAKKPPAAKITLTRQSSPESANKITRYSQDVGQVCPLPKPQRPVPLRLSNEELFRESLIKKLEKVGRKLSVTKSELQQNLTELVESLKDKTESSSQDDVKLDTTDKSQANIEFLVEKIPPSSTKSVAGKKFSSTNNTDKFSTALSQSDHIGEGNFSKKPHSTELPSKADTSVDEETRNPTQKKLTITKSGRKVRILKCRHLL